MQRKILDLAYILVRVFHVFTPGSSQILPQEFPKITSMGLNPASITD